MLLIQKCETQIRRHADPRLLLRFIFIFHMRKLVESSLKISLKMMKGRFVGVLLWFVVCFFSLSGAGVGKIRVFCLKHQVANF